MVLEVVKKSEIRLKSEDFDTCKMYWWKKKQKKLKIGWPMESEIQLLSAVGTTYCH